MKKNLTGFAWFCGLLVLGSAILAGCSQGEQTDPKEVDKINKDLEGVPGGQGDTDGFGGPGGGKGKGGG